MIVCHSHSLHSVPFIGQTNAVISAMALFVFLSAFLASPCRAHNLTTTTLVVAPTGNDAEPGTAAKPLATLSGARDAVRELRRRGVAGPVEVLVQPGIYYFTEPLVLGPDDSGTAAGPTTYRASAEGRVVLSGGVPITGWAQRDGGLWAAPAPAGLDFRLLRVGDRWATRARYPNADPEHPYTGGWLFADTMDPVPAPDIRTTSMRYRKGDLPVFKDVSGAEVHIFLAWSWVNAIVPLARQETEGRRLLFAGQGANQDVRVGNRYFIENLREALDAPGEWFLDTMAGEVLYLPDDPAFPEMPTVAAGLDHLIRFAGDPANDRFVEHVHFAGFAFADTTYRLTDQYYSPQDACIIMAGAKDCSVRECEFSWLGGYALKLSDRSERCVFADNRLHHLGKGGVITVGNTRNQPRHCAIVANHMAHLGLIYKHVAGVYLVSGSDHYIAHNRITDVPRYAVSMKSLDEHFSSHRNVVEFNDIRRTNLETNDTGAIETLGRDYQDSGNVIRYNRILDTIGMDVTPEGRILTPHYSWGIYLDDCSSGTTIFGNIVARTPTGGVCIHGGKNNIVENNILVDGRDRQVHLAYINKPMTGNRFLRNIVAYTRPEAQLIYLFQAWRPNQPGRFAESDFNLYWLTTGDLFALGTNIMPNGPLIAWLAAGFDSQSIIADPQFINPQQDDYRLAPGSPALALGFTPIPVDLIGPDGWQKRGQPLHANTAQ